MSKSDLADYLSRDEILEKEAEYTEVFNSISSLVDETCVKTEYFTDFRNQQMEFNSSISAFIEETQAWRDQESLNIEERANQLSSLVQSAVDSAIFYKNTLSGQHAEHEQLLLSLKNAIDQMEVSINTVSANIVQLSGTAQTLL